MPIQPTGRERNFGKEALIVSKTDLQGKITYANKLFVELSGYDEQELLGRPHALVRHPDMPRSVFKLLWDSIKAGKEIFAYVINLSRNGDHYWVLAHVTPSFDANGRVVGFHSNRRCPEESALQKIRPLYRQMREAEERASGKSEALVAGTDVLLRALSNQGQSYESFIFSLVQES